MLGGLLIAALAFAALVAKLVKQKAPTAETPSSLGWKPCPMCLTPINPLSRVCAHCRRDLPDGWAR